MSGTTRVLTSTVPNRVTAVADNTVEMRGRVEQLLCELSDDEIDSRLDALFIKGAREELATWMKVLGELAEFTQQGGP